MSDVVIKAEHLSKLYKLGVINNGTLWKDFQTWFALKTGKEDPHSKIGGDRYAGNEDHFWALKDLNFEIKQGDRVGIIGKNGAGKSTLLKILSRVTSPTEGVIKVKGKITSLLEVGTGFHGELTGRENIYLNGAILGMKKRQIDRKLDEIIDFSEIEHHIDTPVKRYSSGMYVRLAFAVAAHLDSDILIADEVLAVGDASFQKKALGKMNDLSTGQGRTVLFVSHQMNAIKKLCNSSIILEKGRILHTTRNIIEGIDLYLEETSSSQENQSWNLKSKNYHENFTLEEFGVFEFDGKPLKEVISADRSYMVRIVFSVEKVSTFFSYGIQIYHDSNLIIGSSPREEIPDYTVKRGKNTVCLYIPANLLNSVKYRIELSSSVNGNEWILEPNKNAPVLNFRVHTKKTAYNGTEVGDNRPIRPILGWTVDN